MVSARKRLEAAADRSLSLSTCSSLSKWGDVSSLSREHAAALQAEGGRGDKSPVGH